MSANNHPNSLKNLKPPFAKGHAPLPGGGRPKGARSFADALRKLLDSDAKKIPLKGEIAIMAKEFGATSVREVLALREVLLAFSKSPSASLSAIKEMADRSDGQTAQNIEISQKTDDATQLTKEQLQAIYEGRACFEDFFGTTESISGNTSSGKDC